MSVPADDVIDDALVWLKVGAVTSAMVTEMDNGAEVSVVWLFPAISEREKEPAAASVEVVAPPPSTAVDVAAIVQTVDEL